MVLPAVTTLMGWPNYGPYGTYPQAQLYWLLLGWPLLFNKMFGYGVNQLFNLLLFPTYLPQGYSPLGRCGCVRGQGARSVLGNIGNYSGGRTKLTERDSLASLVQLYWAG